MEKQPSPFERDDEGFLTSAGEIALLRDIRDYAKGLGQQQRDDLSHLIGKLIFLMEEEE